MNTFELLDVLPIKQVEGILPETVTDIAVDSRAIHDGGMFVCIEGYTVDGHRFAKQAVQNGARVVVASKHVSVDPERAAVVYVEDTAKAVQLLAPRFFEYPSKQLTMIGVTGTNGKTSVSNMIHQLLRLAGEQSAVSGTIGFNLNDIVYETDNTTTDVITTQQMIAQAAKEGCSTMTMEVSSHGLVEGRLAGTEFDIAIFTNLSHDHLDFHETMDNYGSAKGLLFAQLGQQLDQKKYGIVNVDDPWGKKIAGMTSHPILTYGVHEQAAFQASDLSLHAAGTEFTLDAPDGRFHVSMPLIGEFNVYNALAAIAALYAKGIPSETSAQLLSRIPPVKGRMEKVETSLPLTIFIDYAHSPDAIEKAIAAVLPYKQPENQLIFLVGTGGNRDRKKRPVMAEKASVADYVVLTTDDPRDEPYDSILSELGAGMTHERYACIGDREEAVRHAVSVANEGDFIIFAGKGHEDFQIIGTTKYPHSDAAIALEEAEKKFGQGAVKKS